MAKKPKNNPMSVLNAADVKHYRDTEKYVKMVDILYKGAISDISQLAAKVGAIPATDQFSFSKNPAISQQVDGVIQKLASRIQAVIETGDREQWDAACAKSNAFLSAIMRTSALPKPLLQSYQDRNLEALAAFQERKINGLGLSERVWNYVSLLKQEIETVADTSQAYMHNGINTPEAMEKVERALGSGLSADDLSREVRSCLKEPDKLFRRVRDKYGNLHLSKNAKLYHPGQGVYRSSYKNAMRMTRSEINMSYRQSDYLRWQQLDFVVGLRVQLSGNHTCLGKDGKPHPFYDICDILAGDYPKDFKFTGWHPQCRCIATPIMKPYDEWNEDRKHIDEKAYRQLPASNEVTDMPQTFKDYIRENQKRIAGWSSTPYYIKDNPHYVDKAINPGTYKVQGTSPLKKDVEEYIKAYNNPAVTKDELKDLKKKALHTIDQDEIDDQFRDISSKVEYTKEQKKAIRKYASGSYDLNTALDNGDLDFGMEEHIKVLDSAFFPIEKDTVVYKGWLKGEFTETKGYQSTSTNVLTAESFATRNGGIEAFLIPKGTPVIYGNELETEIILPRGFKMKSIRIDAPKQVQALQLSQDQRKQLEDFRMYAYNHQGSKKFGTALDDALKARLAGDQKAYDAAIKTMTDVQKTNERVHTYLQEQKKNPKAAPPDPSQLRKQYDDQIAMLKKNADRYGIDVNAIDEAYVSLDLKRLKKVVDEQQKIMEEGMARRQKIYEAADKRHAAQESKLGGLSRTEYAEKVLAERRAGFEDIQKKTEALEPQASAYTKDIDLTKLRDLQKRKQYNQMAKENAAIEAKIAEIKAADAKLADLIPDIATLHNDHTLEEIKAAYSNIEQAIKMSKGMSLQDQEQFLEGFINSLHDGLVKTGLGRRLQVVKTDIKIESLAPDITDILTASQKTSVGIYQATATKAQSALAARDVAQAEALLKQAQSMRPVVDQYEALKAMNYTTSGKFNKAMDDCLQALNDGDVAAALKHVQNAAKIKADNDANVARRNARNARRAAEEEEARRKAEEAAQAKKKTLPEAESIDDIKEILGDKTPVLLQHYEKSVARTQYTDKMYLEDEKEFHDKMKAMFDESNFSHCFKPQYLEGYLDKGILTNLQTGDGDYDSRRAYGHFAYGFQGDKRSVPRKEWLKDGDYYRCGVPVSKDATEAYRQLSGYGECQLVLRKDKVVTTFTFDNSLNQDTIPSLTCDPKTCSLDSKNMRRFKDKKYNSKTVADGSWNDYIEIQYLPMGNTQYIGPECFQSITLPEHPVGYCGHKKDFWQKWADKGVDVMYYDRKTGKVVTYLKGKGAIPPKYNETAAQRKARQANASKRAAARHAERDKLLKKQGLTPDKQIEVLIAKRAEENAKALSYAFDISSRQKYLINADFGKDKFKRLDALIKAGNARAAKTEALSIQAELKKQTKELEKLKDLIPDYEKWHKDFTMEELKRAYTDIQKQISWMESKYPNRNDPNEVIDKWGRIAKFTENPDHGVRSKTWEVAKTAYLRKRDELIYQYRKDSIEENLAALRAFRTKDKDFMNTFKNLESMVREGKWANAEELIEKAKARMLELTPAPTTNALKLGESARLLFDSEDFSQARKDAAKWFRCPKDKETSAQIKRAFKEADDYMSQYAEEMWKKLTPEEKHILWLYTDGSQYINQEMLGQYQLHLRSWIDKSMRNGLDDANVLTSILGKAPALKDDIWMQSGKSEAAFKSIFGINLRGMTDASELKTLIGKEGTSNIFMSCHAARDGAFTKGASTGDDNNIVLSIFMPKGTKGAYMEPFASWGDSKRGEEGYKWDGKKRKEAPSDQVEFLLQRGAKFRITKAVYDSVKRKWYVDVDLIEQKAVGALKTTIKGLDKRWERYKAPAS